MAELTREPDEAALLRAKLDRARALIRELTLALPEKVGEILPWPNSEPQVALTGNSHTTGLPAPARSEPPASAEPHVSRLRDKAHCNDWYLRQEAADLIERLVRERDALAVNSKRLEDTAARIAAKLTRRAEAAEQDAARYRWLREYCKTPYDQRSITLLGDTLDEVVDAQLADSAREGKG